MKRGLTRNYIYWRLDLRLLASKTAKINVCCLRRAACGILLWYSAAASRADQANPHRQHHRLTHTQVIMQELLLLFLLLKKTISRDSQTHAGTRISRGLLRTQSTKPCPRISDSVGLGGWGLRICIFPQVLKCC